MSAVLLEQKSYKNNVKANRLKKNRVFINADISLRRLRPILHRVTGEHATGVFTTRVIIELTGYDT